MLIPFLFWDENIISITKTLGNEPNLLPYKSAMNQMGISPFVDYDFEKLRIR